MQLRGLKVHFQEDAELMRGAGPCGCLQIVLVLRKGAGPCQELCPHPPESWVSRAKSTLRSPGRVEGRDCLPVELLQLRQSSVLGFCRGLGDAAEAAWPGVPHVLPCRGWARPALSLVSMWTCFLGRVSSIMPLKGPPGTQPCFLEPRWCHL